jgi:hypothetical protein
MRPSPRDPDLTQLLDDAIQSARTLLELAPLDDAAVVALVQTELGVPPGQALTRAVRRAGGNPLLVVEMLRSLAAEEMLDLTGDSAVVSGSEMPDSVRQLALRRLGYLPERTVVALRLASLLGVMSSHFPTWPRSRADERPTSSRIWARRSGPAPLPTIAASSPFATSWCGMRSTTTFCGLISVEAAGATRAGGPRPGSPGRRRAPGSSRTRCSCR